MLSSDAQSLGRPDARIVLCRPRAGSATAVAHFSFGTALAQLRATMAFLEASPELLGNLDEIGLIDLERRARNQNGRTLPLKDWVALAEAWRIAQALSETRGNRSAAARLLGIGRRTLYSKMEKLSLEPSWGVTRQSADFVRRPRDIGEKTSG
jgi:ActR/RegA family two-component response regulator